MDNMIILIISAVVVCATAFVSASMVRKAEREKQEALQKVSEAKTEFLSQISNDIKTPMNVIVGMTALGMEETDNSEKMAECLHKIDTASRFLMGLLNDLVDVSKIEMGEFHLHPRAYAFSDFVESTRMMMETACAEKQITFRMSAENMNLNVLVDPMRFAQLFMNLLNNAVKFTPEGGTVSFRVCNYATHNNMFSADYIVQDTGIGMSEKFQKLLFEPFSQEKRSEAEKRHGVGLGLAIVQNIVNQMGGTIEIKSEKGKGTEVKVHLDVELAQIQPEKTGERMGADVSGDILKGKRILLVEDHPLNIEISRRILERRGMSVACAENGNTALNLFEGNEPYYFDAILMDLQMPEMDGLEAARRIRRVAHRDAQIIPIIAMSASDEQEDIAACREAGMNAHVAKPVEPQKLYQVLCEYLENPI